MSKDYEVRKRLLALDSSDISRIAEHPGLGERWARRANVKHGDLVKGSPRALKGLKAAMVKDSSTFATDLAHLWDIAIALQLAVRTDEPDPTFFGVRSAATLIGSAGARALVSCLAIADFEVSAETAERFDELSDAADEPLSEDEQARLTTGMEAHLPEEVLARLSTEVSSSSTTQDPKTDSSTSPPVPNAGSTTIQSELDAVGAEELISNVREHASQTSAALSAAVEDILAGKTVPCVDEEIRDWNDVLTNAWTSLGGPSTGAVSFSALEDLRRRIVQRESDAIAAEAAREEKLAKLGQLRQTAAALEPMIETNESFQDAYRVACDQITALEDELGDKTFNGPASYDDQHDPDEAARPTVTPVVLATDIPEASDSEDAPPTSGEIEAEKADDGSPERPADASDKTDQPGEDAATEQADHPHDEQPPTGEALESPTTPAPRECADELTFHVSAGRFGAAWLVAWASGLPEHEVTAYRLSAAAFHSAPGGGIDPSDVLIKLTSNLSSDAVFSSQSARVALAATMRAALAAGWSPRSELEVVAAHANLDAPGRDLVNAVIAASDRAYQHLHDSGGGLSLTLHEAHDKARELRTWLEGLRIKFARADKVLKFLLRAGEPIGAALDAVLADTTGEGRREALTTALARLESPDDVIDAADSAVSTPQQRRNPIESHALRRLRRSIEAAAECVTEALKSALVVADDSRTVVAQEVRNALIAAANALPTLDAAGPGDVALARLRHWIVEPDPPIRVPSELHLLLDESLPAVSAARDDDGLPLIDSDCTAAVVEELRSPGSWHTLFDAYIGRGDLQEAEAVGRHAPELLDRLATARTDWKRRLQREVSAARADLARTYADGAMGGPQADNAHVAGEAQLVAPGEYTGVRYDLQMADLKRLREALADHRAGTAEHLRERVHDEISDDADRNRILTLIDGEEFVGANELLALARRGPLPPVSQDRSAGSHIFNEFVEAFAAVDISTEPSVHDLVSAFADGRLDEVGESDKARLGSWGNLILRGRQRSHDRSGKLFAVLRALGLDTRGEPSRQTSQGVRHFDLFRVNAAPVDGSLVPGLGSQATHYMVVVTADHSLLRETLSSGFPVKNGPNIVLFDGLLTMDQRRQCLSVCREKKISAIVVDHAVAAFVAARHPRSFRAVQQLTLPFTCFAHYTVVAGNVPDEVFVGRNDELAQLTDRTGSLFVYGGRQLGKSALLRKIQRDFNAVSDHHAIFIDLNSHGIGTWADPQQLWPVLHNELAKIASMDVKGSPAVRNHDVVIKAIRQWLDAKESRRLLLLLDEADAFLEKESREAPNGFRNIGPLKGLFDDTEGRFKPVFAGLHKVQRLQNVANTPLAHGGRDVLIGPLAANPARDLVVKPLEALGYRFDNPEAVWRLLAFTNLQPGLIQVVCNDLVAHLQSRPLRKGEPLITIGDNDVDYVTAHETTRSKIAEKLRLTIALEDRYRVIALTVAIMSMEDSFREKYAASDIRTNCEEYWRQGFQDLNSAEFEVYLDELVGLGVLTRDDENLFAVRSPNIVTMLGSREQLATELLENMEQFELPHEYNPRSTRRQAATSDGTIRSPLSEHDLSQLMPVQKKYLARDFVIVGGESLGITDVTSVLTHVGGQRRIDVTVIDAMRHDIASALTEFRWAGGGTSSPRAVVVDGSQVDPCRADAIVAAAASVRKRGHGHLVIVLGPGGIDTVGRCRHNWSHNGTKLITLEKWSGDGIRSWHDNPFNTPTNRHDLLCHSGGWPELVERAVIDVATRNISHSEEWDRLSRFPEDASVAETFLQNVGIGESQLPLLTAWVELGSVTHESVDDIAAVLDRDIDEIRSAAAGLTLLGAVNESQGDFLVDPVVARAVTKRA
ncbi:DUF2339 domain-containing protein [Mycolicibacterium septicum]|uniref:AAA family ATPase n=1 Tax=Mycolicibacterium septicum TaxID=98668 RepID=UPI001AF88830|nr:AAA family ATPase [Mycolicibacterium septicum]QRY53809.1 AAA family ATPase [Mycolicibacterium septicum]